MTNSTYIVDIISENVAAITPTAPGFSTSETWQKNLTNALAMPHTFLERPLIEKGHLHAQGNPQSTYPLSIYFLGAKHRLEAKQESIEASLAIARDLKRQFLIRLNADKRVKEVGDYNTVEVQNFLDLNCSAIWLKVDVVVDDAGSVCVA